MLRGKLLMTKKSKSLTEGLPCNYPHRTCMKNRHESYEYCIKHILEDKTAPFKQCGYVFPKNGKRCPNATSKLERKEGYCAEHVRRVALLQQKAIRIKRPPETPISIIEDLDHYNIIDAYSNPDEDVSKFLSTQELINLPLQAPASRISRIIDYTSDSDSESELMNIDQGWKGNAESDAESIDSEHDDPLKHAGVYTAEEATLITRDKLIRLQSLYIEQFKRLQHVLREKRRKYLQNMKQERESQVSSHSEQYSKLKEHNQYKKLKYLLRYHRLNGVEQLMHHQSKEKRKCVSEGANYKPATITKCVHQDREKKCGQRAIPFSRFCVKHILEDPHQVLYRPCNGSGGRCFTPIVSVVDMGACLYHCTLPPMPSPVAQVNPKSQATTTNTAALDQLNPLAQQSEDICGLQSSDFGLNAAPEMQCPIYGESAAGGSMSYMSTASAKELWNTHMETPKSKLREELESIDLTPGDLPPEQLLATS